VVEGEGGLLDAGKRGEVPDLLLQREQRAVDAGGKREAVAPEKGGGAADAEAERPDPPLAVDHQVADPAAEAVVVGDPELEAVAVVDPVRPVLMKRPSTSSFSLHSGKSTKAIALEVGTFAP
jgi:hypothetical protein